MTVGFIVQPSHMHTIYGIIPQGSQHQNVSHSNRGFYLSHTYQAAGDWAIKMCSIGGSMNILATVLIFKLSCD